MRSSEKPLEAKPLEAGRLKPHRTNHETARLHLRARAPHRGCRTGSYGPVATFRRGFNRGAGLPKAKPSRNAPQSLIGDFLSQDIPNIVAEQENAIAGL